MSHHYFITSTGTGIGKTHFVTSLVRKLIEKKITVAAYKPVISGFDYADESDTSLILKSQNLAINQENIEQKSPWRFKDPLSPDVAAKNENRQIDFAELCQFCKNKIAEHKNDYLFFEAVGGVMVPLNENKTVLDWMAELNIKIILVTGNYLGAISHGLTAYEVIKNRKLDLHKIYINNYPEQLEIKESLSNFIPGGLITSDLDFVL